MLNIYISLIYISTTYSQIIIPFKLNGSDKPATSFRDSQYSRDLASKALLSELEIGTPTKKITTLIDFKGNNIQIQYKEDIIGSTTYIKDISVTAFTDNSIENGFKETIYFYKDINLQEKVKAKDIIMQSVKEKYTDNSKNYTQLFLILDLQIPRSTDKQTYNIIYQLKEKGLIQNYNWNVFFKAITDKNNNKYDGFIAIGFLPHELDSQKYNKRDLSKSQASLKFLDQSWDIHFDKIYYEIKDDKNDKKEVLINYQNTFYSQGTLQPNLGIICSTGEFQISIEKDFFNKFIQKNICRKTADRKYSYIYCEEEDFKNEIQHFPTIKFQNRELNMIFELDYNDLFRKQFGYYYFLIAYDNSLIISENDWEMRPTWELGQIFMRKYQFTFDEDSKLIGYYNTEITKSIPKVSGGKVFLIIVLLAVFCCLGFFVGRFIFKKTFKRTVATELDNDFVEHKVKKENESENCELYTQSN